MMTINTPFKILQFFLSVIPLTSSTADPTLCSKNSTLLEITGDAILNVFVDAYSGQYCNVSSFKGLQQISTMLYVVQTLNEHDRTSEWQLGLKVYDTCHDRIKVFKQVLQLANGHSCESDYSIGVLVPSSYDSMLKPIRDYSGLPIGVYAEQNLTAPAIDILAHYLSTRHRIVDLVFAGTDLARDRFLRTTKDAGVCVKRDGNVDGEETNVTETLIVAIGERIDIRRWLRKSEDDSKNTGRTWFLLPLDNSDIDDLTPAGSYIIKPETLDFDRNFSTMNMYLENSAIHSPYLLSIGKAIVGLMEALLDIRGRNCSNVGEDEDDEDDDDRNYCIELQLRLKSQREIRDCDMYEMLRIQPNSYSVKYVVAMKTQHDLVDVASYEIEMTKFRVLPGKTMSGIPGLCLRDLVGNCENCTNFQERPDARVVVKADTSGRQILKNSIHALVFLIAIICGTLVCCVIIIFIVYRFATEEMLYGDPTLTLFLILANVFTLLAALPFCMVDDYFGAESLNARKILLTTLAFGFTFSIMLSRALLLALSTGGVFIAHIKGYLQSIVMFFMSGVQVAMSIMYFVLNTMDSAVIARSLIFVALLGYDIFLLVTLFVVCCFITQIKRNYYEAKCFLGTAVGLLVVWAIWLICFILTQPENRDAIVSFGTVSTAYLIIFGVLIPRTYYMIVHPSSRRCLKRRFDSVDLPSDSTVNTISKSRPFCDHVRATRDSRGLPSTPLAYSNYYGTPSASQKCPDRCGTPIRREIPGNSNYGFHAEITEIEIARGAPQTCLRRSKSSRDFQVLANEIIYEQPRIYETQTVVLNEKADVKIARRRENFSPSLKLRDEVYPAKCASPRGIGSKETIDEEDEDGDKSEDEYDERDRRFEGDEGIVKVTHF